MSPALATRVCWRTEVVEQQYRNLRCLSTVWHLEIFEPWIFSPDPKVYEGAARIITSKDFVQASKLIPPPEAVRGHGSYFIGTIVAAWKYGQSDEPKIDCAFDFQRLPTNSPLAIDCIRGLESARAAGIGGILATASGWMGHVSASKLLSPY